MIACVIRVTSQAGLGARSNMKRHGKRAKEEDRAAGAELQKQPDTDKIEGSNL